MNRSKKSANRIRKLLVVCSLMTVIIAASTYAWFVGMKTVNVSSFDVEIESTESLLLSLNGTDWGDTVNISSSTFDSSSYVGNTNKWAGRGLIPMSSVGGMDSGASRMMIYEKASLTSTPGGYRLMASRVDNYSVPTAEEPDGYVVFDLFIKNFSGAQYLENLNILDEEAIYLTVDSEVTVAESGVANTGIENSVRVAFAQVGRVKGTTTDAAKINGIVCAPTPANGVTGICRTNIWEPNDTNHETNAISWYDASCLARTGADVTAEESYSGPCETIIDGTAYPTYAINDDILLTDNVDIYDGEEYNGYTPSSKMGVVDTFTDTDKLKVGTSRPAFMMLAPNSITKVRVYIYIEGQDIDNYDFASIGKAISVKFGFTKERFEQGSYVREEEPEEPIVYTNAACFSYFEGAIMGYNDYENGDNLQPACPKNVVIPLEIEGYPVTSLEYYSFFNKGIESINIPDSVTLIGESALRNNLLTGVTLPDNLETIGNNAFDGNQLISINIPDSVVTIGDFAFQENSLTALVLPSGLERINYYSFYNNDLESISLPSALTYIDGFAFTGNQLTSIDIPDSVTYIGMSSFQDNALNAVTLPDSLVTIADYAFYGNDIGEIIFPDQLQSIGGAAFYENQITGITIPSSVMSLYSSIFEGNQLTSVCIKGKTSSANFTVYQNPVWGPIWGWANGYSDSNITWNCTN